MQNSKLSIYVHNKTKFLDFFRHKIVIDEYATQYIGVSKFDIWWKRNILFQWENLKNRINPPIKLQQYVLKDTMFKWLETILLTNDKQSEKLSNWCIGFYHCKHCDTYEPYMYKLPEKNKYGDYPVNAEAIASHNTFRRNHNHGDGRVLLFP